MTQAAPITVEKAWRDAVHTLREAGSATPDIDANLLLEHTTGQTVLDRITNGLDTIAPELAARFQAALELRISGVPVHRILGSREFYGLELALNADTLVPRPDTEILIDMVLPFVHATSIANGCCSLLDLGTGSGAIALAILHAEQRATATATDISDNALAAAAQNASAHCMEDRFTALKSNWFGAVDGQFDLIVSNPPYIASKTIETLDREVRDHDPRLALDGGPDGLDAYRIIATGAGTCLAENGRIGVEIGFDQHDSVTAIFQRAGYTLCDQRMDLAGHDRALFFCKS